METKIKQWLDSGIIYGDDTYIGNDNIIFRKDKIYERNNEFLVNLLPFIYTKNKINMDYIPFERGKEVTLPNQAGLSPFHRFYLDIEGFHFNYDFIDISFFVLEIHKLTLVTKPVYVNGREKQQAFLKFWDEADEFLGCTTNFFLKDEIQMF